MALASVPQIDEGQACRRIRRYLQRTNREDNAASAIY